MNLNENLFKGNHRFWQNQKTGKLENIDTSNILKSQAWANPCLAFLFLLITNTREKKSIVKSGNEFKTEKKNGGGENKHHLGG